MSRSKVSILSKYVMAIAILALLFSVAITSARYALESYGSSSIGIESFDVDVALYDEDGNEVSGDITLDDTTEDLSSYSKVYYLYINNNDKDTLYYKIEETTGNFCFKVDTDDTRYTTYGGSLEATSSTQLTLTLSVQPGITINTGETQSLSISLYAEYQHTEAYESVEVIEPEPEPEPEDTNHPSSEGWIGLSSSNYTEYLNLTSSTYKFYLAENITLGSNYFNWSGVNVTMCLNTHTLQGSGSYVFYLNSGASLTIEDCQDGGVVSSNTSNSQTIYLNSNASLSMTSGTVKGGNGSYAVYLQSSSATLNLSGTPVIEKGTTGGVYLPTGAYINLAGELEEGADINVYPNDLPYWDENLEHLSVQLSTNESTTYYYETAVSYIHCDCDGYKFARSNDNRCLNIVQTGLINISIAVKNTTTSTSPSFFYVNGFTWDGAESGGSITWTTSSYNGHYDYDQYYDFGVNYNNSDYSFSIAPDPFGWSTNLDHEGLAPDNTLASKLTQANASSDNFGLYATQYQGQVNDVWIGALWYLNLWDNVTDYTTLDSIGDLTLVLEYDGSSLDTSNWDGTNNVVTNVYFITTDGIVTI